MSKRISTELESKAIEKLAKKGVDAIISNPLQTMNSQEITATIYFKDGRTISPNDSLSKPAFAAWLIETLSEQQVTT